MNSFRRLARSGLLASVALATASVGCQYHQGATCERSWWRFGHHEVPVSTAPVESGEISAREAPPSLDIVNDDWDPFFSAPQATEERRRPLSGAQDSYDRDPSESFPSSTPNLLIPRVTPPGILDELESGLPGDPQTSDRARPIRRPTSEPRRFSTLREKLGDALDRIDWLDRPAVRRPSAHLPVATSTPNHPSQPTLLDFAPPTNPTGTTDDVVLAADSDQQVALEMPKASEIDANAIGGGHTTIVPVAGTQDNPVTTANLWEVLQTGVHREIELWPFAPAVHDDDDKAQSGVPAIGTGAESPLPSPSNANFARRNEAPLPVIVPGPRRR